MSSQLAGALDYVAHLTDRGGFDRLLVLKTTHPHGTGESCTSIARQLAGVPSEVAHPPLGSRPRQ